MTKLRISEHLSLPLDWMTLATVVYGARGSGKTTLGSVIAEEVTKAKQRFCAIDLKGDWYGLKSSADGKTPGIPVVVFGGDHQDVPLEEGAGAFIGETIAQLEQPAILDLEHLSKGKQVRFLAAFFERLYDRNRDPLLLLLDEAQRYAPQKPFDPDAAKCLGAVEDLVKLGRKHGIGPMLFTQRGSGLNKEVSELCDMLVAFRTPGPLDQDRVKGWLEANVTREQQQAVMSSLSGLATGTAVFASGHPDLKIFGTYAVRRRETFDSSATPKVGQTRKEPKKLAQPDLELLRQRMADAIERQKADDPKALRARIRELEQQAQTTTRVAEKVITKIEKLEIPVLKDAAVSRFEKAVTQLTNDADRLGRWETALREVAREISGALSGFQEQRSSALAKYERSTTHAPAPRPQVARATPERKPAPEPRQVGDLRISGPQQRILDALAWIEAAGLSPRKRNVVANLADASPKSSGFEKNVSTLSSAGLIHYPGAGTLALTEAGRAAAQVESTPLDAQQLQQMVFGKVSGPQAELLRALIPIYPNGLSRDELANRAGVSAKSSGFEKNVSTLSSFGWVVYPDKGHVAASPDLFLEGSA